MKVANGADIPVENAASLIPFSNSFIDTKRAKSAGPLRILHYGDSHTAADEMDRRIARALSGKFGDGGSGYSFRGPPVERIPAHGRSHRIDKWLGIPTAWWDARAMECMGSAA